MENEEVKYPTRQQIESGLEVAESIPSPSATRFRYMLHMHDEIDRLNALIEKFEEVVKEMRTQQLPDWLWMKSYALLGEAQKGRED